MSKLKLNHNSNKVEFDMKMTLHTTYDHHHPELLIEILAWGEDRSTGFTTMQWGDRGGGGNNGSREVGWISP